MPHFPQNETVVVDVAGERCVVVTDILAHCSALQSVGFSEQAGRWQKPIRDHAERLALLNMLIELKAIFVAGRDWSPQDVVEHYRGIGAIASSYRSISWLGPDRYRVDEHE
jgi:hypothetical protein